MCMRHNPKVGQRKLKLAESQWDGIDRREVVRVRWWLTVVLAVWWAKKFTSKSEKKGLKKKSRLLLQILKLWLNLVEEYNIGGCWGG